MEFNFILVLLVRLTLVRDQIFVLSLQLMRPKERRRPHVRLTMSSHLLHASIIPEVVLSPDDCLAALTCISV
jgi:hypothetical protein